MLYLFQIAYQIGALFHDYNLNYIIFIFYLNSCNQKDGLAKSLPMPFATSQKGAVIVQ